MCKKLILLVSVVLVLSLVSNASAELVAHWSFDEGSGTTAYDLAGGNDGTLQGDPQWVAGYFGYALEFDGSGDYIDIAYSSGLSLNEFTLSAWVNIAAEPGVFGIHGTRAGVDFTFDVKVMDSYIHGDIGNGSAWIDTVLDIESSHTGTTGQGGDLAVGTWYMITYVFDNTNQEVRLFLDGDLKRTISISGTPLLMQSGQTMQIGGTGYTGELMNGLIDDVRIYNHALTEGEILAVMEGGEGYPYALGPNPTDGSLHMQTWVSLGWRAGDFAVSHDVYMGDNFDDVNDGTGDTFRGNQPLDSLYFVAGFTGYAFPDGLVNGETYYWRIDEVNDADPNSPWKGKVWSFSIPSLKAYYPVPSDGSKFIDSENPVLTWTAGFGSVLHTVYFGDDYDTVATATTGGLQQSLTTFSPGPLETEKTYFWRIDEFDEFQSTHTGNVWSFTTAKIGGGLRADYYHWTGTYPPANAFQVFVTSEMVDEVNWNWGDPGSPNTLINDNYFGCIFTGEVEAAFTETYTFYMTTDDGQRLWIDGQPVIDMWVQQGMTEHSGTIDLVAGQRYSIEAWMYEAEGGAGCEMRWSSPSTQKQIIPQAAFSPPVRAMAPSPANRATGTKMTPTLRWNAGESAASHEVYFGTDANAVKNATTASPEYIGPRALGDESYDPGKLAWFTQYFWRVDEVNNLNPDSPWIGNLWSFTTGDFLVVDDFEAYNVGDNEIWFSWNDGLGAGALGTPGYVPPNGTGAMVGDDTNLNSYTEETIVHGGSQSMPYWYDNNKQGSNKYSEAKLTLTAPRDWTEEGVAELSLWFRGNPASVGSFVEGPVGTYTMTASGADIWNTSDEFHFAYKTLTGVGTIQAQVLSIDNTDNSAKAGVMIRETLDADSKYAIVAVTPGSGVISEGRIDTGIGSQQAGSQTGITAPYWVKLERDVAGNFTASSSANGSTWTPLGISANIAMGSNVHIGLAVTSHDAALTCQAVFSNVTTTGTVSPQWAHQDIGITSNAAEPLYVAVSNSAGTPAVVVHDDPAAATIDTWTEWVIPLQVFEDQGIVLTNVDSIAIGLGTQGNITIPGGSGKMYFDDIRLYRPREVAGE